MTWIETDSLSFTARHDDEDLACAQRVLDELEDVRLRLEDRFSEVPGNVTIVLHDNPAWLSAAHPLLPAVRWSAAPAARRYLAGWPMAGEIHTLNDSWMERRSAGEDSLRALRGTAERMYCQIVLAANNDQLPPMWTPRRFVTYLRWAWLIEGAAQYFTGQTSLFRAAVITRLREGERPAFPPSRRDALILGGTPDPTPAPGWRQGSTGRGRAATSSSPSRRGCGRSSAPGACTSTRSSTRSPSPCRSGCELVEGEDQQGSERHRHEDPDREPKR
jgi:hypothetical protein